MGDGSEGFTFSVDAYGSKDVVAMYMVGARKMIHSRGSCNQYIKVILPLIPPVAVCWKVIVSVLST
jgi:hypothetical protein